MLRRVLECLGIAAVWAAPWVIYFYRMAPP